MKQLEELEKKVLNIIKKNKELDEDKTFLKMENEELRKKNIELENNFATKNKNSKSLESEKIKMKSSIEDLLSSISSLEKIANKEPSK
ncbi:hypothetical protein KAT08_03855 [Candidatus Babeliales bacterium]|nr:hypothetical protein [Candidatus Babeliales bacterium]